jgi:hypothetical protein
MGDVPVARRAEGKELGRVIACVVSFEERLTIADQRAAK